MTYLIQSIKHFITNKKVRYFFISLFLALMLFVFNEYIISSELIPYVASFFILFVIGVFIALGRAQYISKELRPLIYTLVLPLHLIVGFFLAFYFFPNLGPLVKVLAYIAFLAIMYTVFLVNNIFLVVIEKGSLIPLYNVAITWIQVLIIVISIPYISGIYKLPINFLYQNFALFLSIVMFNFYLIWATYLDSEIRRTGVEERFYISTMLSFFVTTFGLSTSFIPTESFLRALLISAVIMLDLSYLYAHYKNRINRRLIVEYLIIITVFFLILVTFRP